MTMPAMAPALIALAMVFEVFRMAVGTVRGLVVGAAICAVN